MKERLVKKVCAVLALQKLEKYVPIILKMNPQNLPQALLKMKKENQLTDEMLGDFIQKLLLEKYEIHKKNPKFKSEILDFSKEHHIRGIQFPYL